MMKKSNQKWCVVKLFTWFLGWLTDGYFEAFDDNLSDFWRRYFVHQTNDFQTIFVSYSNHLSVYRKLSSNEINFSDSEHTHSGLALVVVNIENRSRFEANVIAKRNMRSFNCMSACDWTLVSAWIENIWVIGTVCLSFVCYAWERVFSFRLFRFAARMQRNVLAHFVNNSIHCCFFSRINCIDERRCCCRCYYSSESMHLHFNRQTKLHIKMLQSPLKQIINFLSRIQLSFSLSISIRSE